VPIGEIMSPCLVCSTSPGNRQTRESQGGRPLHPKSRQYQHIGRFMFTVIGVVACFERELIERARLARRPKGIRRASVYRVLGAASGLVSVA